MANKEMVQRLSELETRLQFLEQFCGVQGPWLSPAQAAKVLPVSRDRIIQEIQVAERNRALRKKSDLVFGEHYFNNIDPHDSDKYKNSWKVHYKRFWDVIKRPPEERVA